MISNISKIIKRIYFLLNLEFLIVNKQTNVSLTPGDVKFKFNVYLVQFKQGWTQLEKLSRQLLA